MGINDIINRTPDFNIYPNPVVNQLNVNGEISKAKSAKIYELSGKLIKEINNPFINQKSIDVQSLLPSTYILNIDGKSVKFIKK